MIRCLAILVYFCGLGAVSAQDVVVRTGEHPTFTRIVLTIPESADWAIEETVSGYIVDFELPLDIDTTRAFERIQRNRISDISVDEAGSQLKIALACDCFADAFLWQADQIVIDVKDPGEPSAPDSLPILAATIIPDERADIVAEFPTPAPVDVETTERLQPLILGPLERGPETRPASPIDPLRDFVQQQNQIQELEQTIGTGLRRAVSQGLLDRTDEALAEVSEDQSLENLLADLETALAPGLTTRTSLDDALGARTLNVEMGTQVTNCIASEFADVANWGGDEPFQQQIGNLRGDITGEFDRTDQTAVETLAKAYVYFGFGREAISVFSIDNVKSQERQVIQAIAEVIDDDPISYDDFAKQMGCAGPIALWGFLAQKEGPKPTVTDMDQIVISFKLLPLHLRRHLAPRLARSLNELGKEDLAEDVLSIALDTLAVPAEATIAASEIIADQGKTQEATNVLATLADDDPRVTTEAILELVNLKLANDEIVEEKELTLVRTFQFESQNEDEQRALAIAEIRVLTQMGEIETVVSLLDQAEIELQAETKDELRDAALSYLLENSADTDFLNLIFSDSAIASDPALQNGIATRLIALGFLDKAETFVSAQTVGGPMMERRYLRAEIAVGRNDAERAKAHLAGMSTLRANTLLTRAGLPPSPEVLASLPEDERAATGWQFEDWADLSELDDPLLQSVSERVQNTEVFQEDSLTPLANGRDMVSNSELLRDDLTALLNRFQLDDIEN